MKTTKKAAHDARPAWARREPRVEVDYRRNARYGEPLLEAVLEAVAILRAGEILLLRADFEPTLLYRLLGSRGFAHCSELSPQDDWRVYFLKKPRGCG